MCADEPRGDLAGFDEDLVEAAVLCASEAFANTAARTRSGEAEGRVVRAPYARTPRRCGW